MFVSFFPAPRWFFGSALLWVAITVAIWYMGADSIGDWFGLGEVASEGERAIGVEVFWSPPFLWFYIYYALAVGIFAGFWMWYCAPSLGALVDTGFGADPVRHVFPGAGQRRHQRLVRAVLRSDPDGARQIGPGRAGAILLSLRTLRGSPSSRSTVGVMTRFFVSHYIFRWRTAMNDYYMAHWARLRHIEGASQRVQEDTMRFSTTVEGLGVSLINSVMTLIAFLPVLLRLSGT